MENPDASSHNASGSPVLAKQNKVNAVRRNAPIVDVDDGPSKDESCSLLCFAPKFLQKARTPNCVLFWLCCAAVIQGIIAGAYDIASVICSIPVSYLGSRPGASKSRWLGWGMFIMATGSLVFASPHFFSPIYEATDSGKADASMVCPRENIFKAECSEGLEETSLSNFRHVFVLGQVLHGIGASPLYTLGVTFMDESVPLKLSSLYLGIFLAMAVIGPACGYVLGSKFLDIFINVSLSPETHSISKSSEEWLGAWWLGFVLASGFSFLIAWPLMMFPTQLPASRVSLSEKPTSLEMPAIGGGMSIKSFKELPRTFKVLLKNVTFVALSLSGATEGMLMAGFATFMPKFIESQFSVRATIAGLLVGIAAVPAGGGGTFLGGWLIKKLRLKCRGILKLCVLFAVLSACACFVFFISCEDQEFAGVTVQYGDLKTVPQTVNLISDCNRNCSCEGAEHQLVCGSNSVQYFSPCHAGCESFEINGTLKEYYNCKCIQSETPVVNASSSLQTAFVGKCPQKCFLLPVFLVLFFIVMLFTFLLSLPALTGTLRCVDDHHRSLCLGVQWILIRLLGTIPGPILFGAVIDKTCSLWHRSCSTVGACHVYNNHYMSRYLLTIAILAKSGTSLFMITALVFYVPATKEEENRIATIEVKGMDSPALGIDNPALEIT